MNQDNLTEKQLGPDGLSQYAVFLPAISGFYATFIGNQRVNNFIDPARMPAQIQDMEQLNWLNSQKSLFPYKWSLYSGGHANLDLTKPDPSEDMVRDREPGSFILGDSGGFQLGKGLWPGEWRDPNSVEVQQHLAALIAAGPEVRTVLDASGNPKTDKNGRVKTVSIDHAKQYEDRIDAAQKKREVILNWLDTVADYAMILDVPTWVIYNPEASDACGIKTYSDAVNATKYNNEYFMANRRGIKNGGAKFLNVLQGSNHEEADEWYDLMKDYCDPKKYPDTHFNGWAMGGQNMCEPELILRRLVALRYDNLLQEGVHDWMHFLGTSKLEWAVLLTDIQRAIRKYVNPQFTISFDCASPFLATANGQLYHEISVPDRGKWSYRMAGGCDNKKYAQDTRPFGQALLDDGLYDTFEESPISSKMLIKDVCIYGHGVPDWTAIDADGIDHSKVFKDPVIMNDPRYWITPGDKNKIDKVGTTSWDSFSYALMMGHNVWMHITAVQRANALYEQGQYPAMMQRRGGDYAKFRDVVDKIFAAKTRQESEDIIKSYSSYWMEIPGTRGFTGKNSMNSLTMSNKLVTIEGNSVKPQPVKKEKSKVILNTSLFEE